MGATWTVEGMVEGKVRADEMGDDIDIGAAYAVQDFATELQVFRSALQQGDPAEHTTLWAKAAKRLWGKTFVMSAGSEQHRAPAVPGDLAAELALLPPWEGAIQVIARARAAVSGLSVDIEKARIGESAARFAETPEGQARQAYLDEHPVA